MLHARVCVCFRVNKVNRLKSVPWWSHKSQNFGACELWEYIGRSSGPTNVRVSLASDMFDTYTHFSDLNEFIEWEKEVAFVLFFFFLFSSSLSSRIPDHLGDECHCHTHTYIEYINNIYDHHEKSLERGDSNLFLFKFTHCQSFLCPWFFSTLLYLMYIFECLHSIIASDWPTNFSVRYNYWKVRGALKNGINLDKKDKLPQCKLTEEILVYGIISVELY